MEQTMKNMEKTFDLDSFGQVSFKLPQPIGEGTSTAAASQAAQERTAPAAGTAKGKEVVDTEQETMTNQPTTSKEQAQGKAPSLQTEAPQVPALQTPLNEERSKKWDREETTPASGSTKQPEAKRQRVDPQTEEEISEEITGSPRKERETSQQTSTSSHRQEMERQHGMEVSSSRQQSGQQSGIKGTFMEIKAQNEL